MAEFLKHDIFKTIIIIWFIGSTGYFILDQYSDYKLKVMQQSEQRGYISAIDDLIKKTKESNCQPFEVSRGGEKANIVSADCFAGQVKSELQSSETKK